MLSKFEPDMCVCVCFFVYVCVAVCVCVCLRVCFRVYVLCGYWGLMPPDGLVASETKEKVCLGKREICRRAMVIVFSFVPGDNAAFLC